MQEYPGLHPELIDNLTFDQVGVMLDYVRGYRKDIPRVDVNTKNLVDIVVSAFGGKPNPPPGPQHRVEDVKLMPKVQITKEELNAFFKAGMPSPMNKWLHEYRRAHKK